MIISFCRSFAQVKWLWQRWQKCWSTVDASRSLDDRVSSAVSPDLRDAVHFRTRVLLAHTLVLDQSIARSGIADTSLRSECHGVSAAMIVRIDCYSVVASLVIVSRGQSSRLTVQLVCHLLVNSLGELACEAPFGIVQWCR